MSHPKRAQKVDRQAEKRAIEVARYVLPVAAATTMVHTLSGIVLHRLWRMVAASDTPAEARAVIGEMVARVREIDPQFFDRFDNAPMETGGNAGMVAPALLRPELQRIVAEPRGEAFAREFDARLGGRVSVLTDFSPQAPRVIAEAYRAVLGLTESACSGRRSARPAAQSRAQRVPSGDSQRRRACADHARAATCQFHVREKDQPHRR